MQQQQVKNHSISKEQTYPQLASLLILFLHSPSPDIEHRLTLFHPELYLQLILNPSQPKEVRQACCASFKAQIINNKCFSSYSNHIIQQIQSAYFSLDDKILADIQGSFQIVAERLFQMYLDDEKKLNAFAGIMQRISNSSDIRVSHNNLRGIKLAFLLLRAMEPSTLNNQVCIGQLICYLKQIYHPKHQTNDQGSVNGRGLQLIQAAMPLVQCQPCLTSFLQIQIQIVKLIKQIIEKLQIEETEQGDSIPAAYIRNSHQIDSLFQTILFVNTEGKIYGRNSKVNQFKAVLIEIYTQQFPYHVSQTFLVLCLSTITKCDVNQLYDHIDTLVAAVLQLLQRSTSHAQYASYYYNNTQILVLKLFELISISKSESDALQDDPEHFVQISDDFCKNQQNQCVKVRAGSLLYNICLTIDGNLTFVTNMAMIPLYALEREFVQKFLPQTKVRQVSLHNGKGIGVLLQLWNGRSPQGLTQASLLIISCISDLIIKRNEFNNAIRDHLNVMIKLFSLKNQILNAFPPVIISRYIQLFSFFSFDRCLDVFLPYYSVKQVYAETILKALETIMHFYDKKDQKMRIYVTSLSTNILLLSQKLTPLLEQTIISRPQLILCIKERLIQKLVIWLLEYYQDRNTLGCNKISNILCKVIEQYPKFMIENDQHGFNFDLQALNQYLLPLYKQTIQSKHHPAEQCIIDIAVSHIQSLGFNITPQLLRSFVQMGVVVTEHNDCVLNKCLQLFSRTISIPNMEKDKQKMQLIKLKNIQVEIAKYLLQKISKWLINLQYIDIDVWQMLFLLQMCLLVLINENPMLQQLNLSKLKEIYVKSNCIIVKIKIYMVWMLLVGILQDDNNDAGYSLQKSSMPQKLPPYEKANFTIYMTSILPYIKSNQFKIFLIRALLKQFFPNEKYSNYLKNYEEILHCSANVSQAQIYAFQAVKNILHPINSKGLDVYKQFRTIYHQITNWQQLRKMLTQKQAQLIREILGREMVGTKPRKIYHVKKIK